MLLMFGFLRLRDTVAGLVLVDVAFLLPLVIWLLRNYIAEVPRSIESAARNRWSKLLPVLRLFSFACTIARRLPGVW